MSEQWSLKIKSTQDKKMTMDKEILREVTQAVGEMCEDSKKYRVKKRAELFKPIDIHADHRQLLGNFTMEILKTIADMWSARGISQLKKAQLVDYLSSYITTWLSSWFDLLNQEQFDLIKTIVSAGGIVRFDEIDDKILLYFRARGVIFSGTFEGQNVLVIPADLLDACKKLIFDKNIQETVKINDEILTLTRGLLIYYGVIPRNQLGSLVRKLCPKSDGLVYWMHFKEFSYYDTDILLVDNLYFSHVKVEEPGLVLQEQLSRDIDYYPVTYQMALKAGITGYADLTFAQQRYKQYLIKNWGFSDEEAIERTLECVFYAQNDMLPGEQINHMQLYIRLENFAQAKELGGYLIDLHNNSRHWKLKGFTPSELSHLDQLKEINQEVTKQSEENKTGMNPMKSNQRKHSSSTTQVVKKEKIGRNDLCPCGSGKKYKKCCGR